MSAGFRKKKNRWKPEKRRTAKKAKPAAKPKPAKKPKPKPAKKAKPAAKPKPAKAKKPARKPKSSKAAAGSKLTDIFKRSPKPKKAKKPATKRRKPEAAKTPRPEPRGLGPLAPLLALLVVCGLLFFAALGERTLWESDESRYGEIAREMVESGNWVTPRLNYVKYFEKPPLTYWLTAISFKAFGTNALAARLVPAVFGMLTVLLIYFLGRLWWDWRSGFTAAFILATSLMFLVLSRVVLVDMVMCFGVVLAFWGFFAHRAGYRHGIWAFWTGLAVGFLSKGLLGPGLPVMALLIYMGFTREWRVGLSLLAPWGPAWFVALTAPWVIWVSIENPEFFKFFFLDEHFGRLLTTRHERWEPFFFYFLVVPGGFFPWVAYLPWAIGQQWPGRKALISETRPLLFQIIWFVSFFVFFTLSRSKMIHYALPMMPVLALLVARPLMNLAFVERGRDAPSALQRSLVILAGLMVLAADVVLLAPSLMDDLAYSQMGLALLIVPVTLLGMGLAIYGLRRKSWVVLVAPLATMLLMAATAWFATVRLEPYRSVAGLTEVAKSRFQYGDRLMTYRDFYNGAAFYSEKRVVVVRHWGELRFGFDQEPTSHYAWFLPNDEFMFKRMLASPSRRVFLISLAEHLPHLEELAAKKYKVPIFVWARQGDKVLLSNRPRR